jgi:hypothetical protein
MDFRRPLALTVVCLGICLGGAGCGGSSEPIKEQAPAAFTNLRIICSAYLKAEQSLDRPPETLNDLLPFIKEAGDPATILRSPDDGAEYKILYGVDILNQHPEDGKLPIIAYEQQGKDGGRYVLQVRYVRRMTDEEFKQARFPPGHTAP